MTEEICSVCFDENYKQNDNLFCKHPLCQKCYDKIDKKMCPICRSNKIKFVYEPLTKLNVKGMNINNNIFNYTINIKNLKKYVFGDSFKSYMNDFFVKRNLTMFIKFNHYTLKYFPDNEFVIFNNQYFRLDEIGFHVLIYFLTVTNIDFDYRCIIYNRLITLFNNKNNS